MSKKILNITISVILLFVFLISASAHSGRTDANGGHWNRSTGEYHYHTGEYAGRSQSSSNNAKATQEAIEALQKKYSKNTSGEIASQPKKKTSFWDVIKIIIGLHIGFFPIVIAMYTIIFDAIGKFIKKLFGKRR